MKPFDLEATKRGDPIVCRDGTPAKFIAHVPEKTNGDTVLVLICGYVYFHYENGRYLENHEENMFDLFMAPKKRTVWVNFYSDGTARFWDSPLNADADANLLSARPRIGRMAYPVEI